MNLPVTSTPAVTNLNKYATALPTPMTNILNAPPNFSQPLIPKVKSDDLPKPKISNLEPITSNLGLPVGSAFTNLSEKSFTNLDPVPKTIDNSSSFKVLPNSVKQAESLTKNVSNQAQVTSSLLMEKKNQFEAIKNTKNAVTPNVKENEYVINDSLYRSMIVDEINNFKREFQRLITRCNNIKLNIGSENEKDNLVTATDCLLDFCNELQDITKSQMTEVHCLKQALIQSFAWYEDAKSRHHRFIDPDYSTLLISQNIDPVSEKQLADIQHLIYYIDSQLKLVDEFLDNQWADFQDSCKKHVSKKIYIPAMEPIYQTMVRINAVLARQQYVLKDIASKIKIKNKKVIVCPDVSDIDFDFKKIKIDSLDIYSLKCEKVLKTQKKYSKMKETKLCYCFTNRQILHVSPKKPKFSSTLDSSTLYNIEMNKLAERNAPKAMKSLSFTENTNEVTTNLSSSNIFTFTLEGEGANSQNKLKASLQEMNSIFKEVKEVAYPLKPEVKKDTIAETNILVRSLENLNKGSNMVKDVATPPKFVIPPVVKTVPNKIEVEIGKPIDDNESEKITLNFKDSTARIILSSPENKSPKPAFVFSQQPNVATSIPSTIPKNNIESDLNNTINFSSHLNLAQVSTPKVQPIKQFNIDQPSISSVPPMAFGLPKTAPVPIKTTNIPPDSSLSISDASSTTALGAALMKPFSMPSRVTDEVTNLKTTVAFSSTTFESLFKNNVPASTSITKINTTATTSIFGKPATDDGENVFKTSIDKPLTASTEIPKSNSLIANVPISTVASTAPASIFSNSKSSTFSNFAVSNTGSIFGNAASSSTTIFKDSNLAVSSPVSSFGSATLPTTIPNLPKESVAENVSSSGTSPFFGKPVEKPVVTSGNILQTGTVPSTSTGKTTSIFGFNNNSSESQKTQPEDVNRPSQELSFGFGSSPSSSEQKNFSFSNLTITALAPKTSTPTSATQTTTFSFTLPTTTQSTIFGNTSNMFGKPASTTSASFMGQPICSPTQAQGSTSIFGNTASAAQTQQNVNSPFGYSTSNIFSQKSPTNTGSIFGQTPVFSNATTASTFIQSSNSLFTAKSTTPVTTSFFAQNTGFGAANTAVSQPNTFKQNTFGSPVPTTTSSTFSFAQNMPSAFSNPSNNVFGSKPAFGQAPVFGQPAVFGNTSPSFGSTTSSASVFGNSPVQTPPAVSSFGSGFGSSPSFGSPPAFGQSSFGAPPTFGGSPGFGSPTSKIFGSPGGSNAFGNAVPENSTFANLASQSTVGFGSLAQSQGAAQPPQVPQFSGGSQFSNWR